MFIDAAYVILLLFAVIKGIRKGFIVAVFSIIAFIAGLAAALKLSAVVANRLSVQFGTTGKWLPLLSFLLVFILVVFLINLGGKLIEKTFQTVMLGWLNRIAGILLYMALYTFIFSIFIFYAVQINLIKPETTSSSFFYPYIQPLGPKVIDSIGSIIPLFKDLFDQLQRFFGGVSNKI